MGRRAPPVTPTACFRYDAGAIATLQEAVSLGVCCAVNRPAHPFQGAHPAKVTAPRALQSLGATQATSHGRCDQHGPAPFGGLTPRYWRLRHFGPAPAPGWARRGEAAMALYRSTPPDRSAICAVAGAPARGAGRAPGHAGRIARSGWPMARRVPAADPFRFMGCDLLLNRSFAADSIHWIESLAPFTRGAGAGQRIWNASGTAAPERCACPKRAPVPRTLPSLG
jgi:hypothetical protein